jgi:nitrate reductase gamma subunit
MCVTGWQMLINRKWFLQKLGHEGTQNKLVIWFILLKISIIGLYFIPTNHSQTPTHINTFIFFLSLPRFPAKNHRQPPPPPATYRDKTHHCTTLLFIFFLFLLKTLINLNIHPSHKQINAKSGQQQKSR